MEPANHKLNIYIGADFEQSFVLTVGGVAMDLTGYSAESQIRDTHGRLIADLTVAVVAAEGRVTVSLLRADTALIQRSSGEWDLFLINPSGKAEPYISGSVEFWRTSTVVADA